MPKKFKHKTLGWIAIECEKGSNYMIDKGGTGKFAGTICSMENGIMKEYLVDKQLIENSSDREEIIENDWISQCVEEIFEYQRGFPYEDEPDYVSIRKIIQKHAPKQKKFTREELFEECKAYGYPGAISCLERFCQENDLLEQ